MNLSSELISQFVKATKDNTKTKSETIVYGTVKKINDVDYVQLDGSELYTPVVKTADVQDNERVTVMIKNHTATITGNLSSPAARNKEVKDVATKLDNIDATYASVESLEAVDAKIDNLGATYATIKSLDAVDARIDNLGATYATITNLNAAKADIKDLDADVANIDTLIFGSATGDTIQTSFSNAVIAQLGNAQIKSAMIESVSAGKITSGDIITNNVRVKSEDGSLLISDETMQISDDTRVRVQIGKDATGDYSINIWDQNGNLMFSKGGITDSAIKDAIIRNDMVSDTANIAAHKLDIDSLFEEINGSTNTIKSTQVYLDDKKQTLDVAFKSLSEEITDLDSTVSTQGTQISAVQGQIASKIWQQDINTAKGEMSTQYSTLEQELDGISATVASHTSQIATKADSSTVTTVNNKVASLESNLSGFKTTVSDTYATKTQVNSLDIGGRNWLLKTAAPVTVTGDGTENQCVYLYHFIDDVLELAGKKISISFEYTISDYESGYFRLQTANKTWIGVTSPITPTADGTYTKQGSMTLSTATGYTFIQVRMDNFVGSITFSKMKVELGDKCTDWTPAPEDMANASDLSELTERVSTAETTIIQNTEAIESRATKTEVNKAIDGIAIGGRNIIRESTLSSDTELWGYDYNHQSISFDKGYLEIQRVYDASYTSRTFNSQYSGSNPLLLPDEISNVTYVLSADLKAIEGVPLSPNSTIFWRIYYGDDNASNELALSIPTTLSSTEWTRCHAIRTFPTQEWAHSQLSIALANTDNGFCIRNIMLERATKPSAWSPAPEDMATSEELSEVKTRVSTAETKITQNANSITSVASRTTTNETAISTLQQTADGFTARLSSAESDIATAQSTADAAKKQLYHSASGTSGTAGYVGLCQLKVTNNYQNRPILFELANRGQQSSNISLCFNNSNTTDPGLYHFQRDGGINVWAYKVDTSTWQIIAQKSEGYDTVYVKDFSNTNGSVTITWTNIHYNTLPTSNITEATLLAGKIAKSVVDNAAKTATNYLNFSSSGLVVGDMTASTLGKNVLIDSDSVDIRNGSTTLASFGADTITLGQNAENSTINLCDGAGTIKTAISETATAYPKYDALAIESQELNLLGKRIYLDTEYTGSTYNGASSMTLMSTNSGIGSDCTVVATGKTNQTGVSCDATDNYVNTHSNMYAIGWNASTGEYINNYVSVYPLRTQFSQPISINGNTVTGVNKVLWSGGYYMTSGHSCTLSEGVGDQTNGIVLVFSEFIDGEVSNTAFHTRFIPKETVVDHGGVGHCFQLSSSNLAYFGTKYLYISNTKVNGHDNNSLTGASTCGITRSNNRFVLRYVIGV